VRGNGEALRATVAAHGALLVRGLPLRDVAGIEAAFRAFGDPMDETESFASRRRYAPGVYSASRWPANQPLCLHHELSYVSAPPGLMLFACLREPSAGGATVLADASAVPEALPPGWVERFDREGWVLRRTYHDDIGASLADSFGTDDRGAVEAYCRDHGIGFAWNPGGALRTWNRRPAFVRHPVTGRRCWFNQIAFLSRWTMAPDLLEYLVDAYGEDGLPFDTTWGNGDRIEPEVVRAIHEAYEANAVREPWRAGDLLIVDNLRTAHGREAYGGSREILVAMVDPLRRDP
jgi:hypothetical protein